jgi:hypothetical protein
MNTDEYENPYSFIIKKKTIKEHGIKLNLLLVLSLITIGMLFFMWSYNFYINMTNIAIVEPIDDIDFDNLDINYLAEQYHYKLLSNNKKLEYSNLSILEKNNEIKKTLMMQIVS